MIAATSSASLAASRSAASEEAEGPWSFAAGATAPLAGVTREEADAAESSSSLSASSASRSLSFHCVQRGQSGHMGGVVRGRGGKRSAAWGPKRARGASMRERAGAESDGLEQNGQ